MSFCDREGHISIEKDAVIKFIKVEEESHGTVTLIHEQQISPDQSCMTELD